MDMIERLQLFLEEITYTYIKDVFNFNFNGYIKEIDLVKKKIRFQDDKLGVIPIKINEIIKCTYSSKGTLKKNE